MAETNSHLLWEFPFAQNVWAMFKGRIQKSRNEATDFLLLFNQMQQKLSKLDLERWTTTAWEYGMQEIDSIFEQVQ